MNNIINFFSLIIIFIPYISFPGLVRSGSYIQPFTLIGFWSIFLLINKFKFKLKLSKVLIFFSFISYLFLISYINFGWKFIYSTKILIAYFFGIIQFYLFNLVFYRSFLKKDLGL